MANTIPMTTRQAIRALALQKLSERQIAKKLGIHRNTVRNHLQAPDNPNCTISATGSELPDGSSEPDPPPQIGPGRRSHCLPFHDIILQKFEAGLEATRIHQDLCDDHEFEHGYGSVKRYVAKLKETQPKRVWRMECEPGEEAQVDYGTKYVELGGKKKKVHLLRITLSHSRKGYTEAMPRQDTESFIRGIENAFRHFGGVPRLLVLDNLKAGVLKADIYDPELNPKFECFCKHYDVVPLPTRPRTPEHKGKVESAVKYVQNNAVKARSFDSLHHLNRHLRHWEATVADQRVHGTTKRQVQTHFEEKEKAALQELPPDLFGSFVERKHKVHRDGYIEFQCARYEAPEEYIQRELWVRSDGRLVRLYNLRMEEVAAHPKVERGQFSRVLGSGGTPKSVRESLRYYEERAALIGEECGLWANGVSVNRKEAGMRALMGLTRLTRLLPRYGHAALERACAQARLHGQYTMRELKAWLDCPEEQQSFSS